jgi:hypothetical protein
VLFLFNISSVCCDAQESRQRDSFWKDTLGEVDKTLNDEHTLMQDLSVIPELKKQKS